MFKASWPLAMLAAGLAALTTTARAHEIVGNRFFPATLAIDDPGVNDEAALPTISMSKTGNDPSFKQLDVSGEFAKRITEDFAISVAPTWSRLYAPGGPIMNGARGFENLETLFKYRLFKNAEHEFVMSAGLEIEWGGSGAQGVGAERFNVYTPTIYFGKGFGDLPSSLNWARPFAITGQIGYAIPGVSRTTTATINPDTGEQDIDTEFNPRVLNWGATLQYSMPYLKSVVVDLGLPDFINRLIPIVEASLQTPVSNTATSGTVTTGTVNPGIIYVGNKYQVAIEAMIPVNRKAAPALALSGNYTSTSTTSSRTHWDGRSSQTASIQGSRCSVADNEIVFHRHRRAFELFASDCARAGPCHARSRQPTSWEFATYGAT